jgi:hypothetical protein
VLYSFYKSLVYGLLKMKKNLEEKNGVEKITYEEVCEEVLLSLMDEKMSKVAPSLSKEELIKEFNKLKNMILKSSGDFEVKRDQLIQEYKRQDLYDESTDPKVIAQRNLIDAKSNSPVQSSSNDKKINFGF